MWGGTGWLWGSPLAGSSLPEVGGRKLNWEVRLRLRSLAVIT